MAPIDKRLFANGSEIAGEDLQLLEVRNFSEDVDTALKRFKWNGKLCGCIVLKLSADNAAVTSGQFLARGRLCRDEIKIEAAKIWPDAEPGLVLTLQLPDGAMFTFGEGGICSDYLGSDQVEHCVTATGRSARPIPPQEYNDAGIGAFCLRLVCHIEKATVKSGVVLNFNVLIFPGSPDAVGEFSELARNPSWPGLKLADGEMALAPYPPNPWGCPILPLLLTGSPWEEEETHPPFQQLRTAVGAIMATSEPADTCRSRKALNDKWQKYSVNPDEFSPKRGALSWPKPTVQQITGRG